MRKLPDKVKEQRGTLKKSRVNPGQPIARQITTIPIPPASLPESAHRIWYDQCTNLCEMGILTAADLALVESFCVEKMKYDRATEFLETSGLKKPGDMLDSTNKGNTKMVSLYIKIQDQALANMIKISSRFGFDPVSRTSIGASEVKNDPLSDLI
jgi:P27 family predicted phage terminase small subunit